MFFPTTVAGIRAQYNVQITNLISMSVETKVFSKSKISTPQLYDEQWDPDDSAKDELPHLRRLLASVLLWYIPSTEFSPEYYWRCFPAFIFVMIGVLVIFCAFHNSEREDVCDNFQIQQRTFLSQVISWADFLNRRSREVMPFLFAIFLLFFFLIATDVINVE